MYMAQVGICLSMQVMRAFYLMPFFLSIASSSAMSSSCIVIIVASVIRLGSSGKYSYVRRPWRP